MKKVLLTRPQDDSESLAATLAARGWEALIEPMLDIVWLDGPIPDSAASQALLFTSANGVRAFARRSAARDMPVLTVGRASADAARACGFIDVTSADGDADALARLVCERCDPARGPLLHVAGTVTAGDLSGLLTARGFTVERAVLYEARTAASLSAGAMAALTNDQIAAVLFFSPRTARTFVRLLADAGLAGRTQATVALCLSKAVANAARTSPDNQPGETYAWRDVQVAEQPDLGALLALLEGLRDI
ncbi:MAG TPA: uroporphyrinogen-III synthase [Azospirillaceae bacterium]|nr:uroporphyrinogen-III synthase [Azospirillaceae bacterium]